MYALRSSVIVPKPWKSLAKLFMILAVLVDSLHVYPVYPSSKDWVCNAGNTVYNVTLQGGIHAGKFKKVGPTKDMNACAQQCCESQHCDVAFMAKQNCYLVGCLNKRLCGSIPTDSPKLFPRLSYVTKTFFHTRTNIIPNQDTIRTLEPTTAGNSGLPAFGGPLDSNFKSIDNVESSKLREKLRAYAESLQNTNGRKNIIGTSDAGDSEVLVRSQGCYQAKIHKGVSLKYGTRSGEFYDYGEIGDMRMCVDLCCKDKKCDVAFMVGKTCYTISCSSFDFCQMVPSTKSRSLITQLAYVIKKQDSGSEKKLLITKYHEKLLAEPHPAKIHKKKQLKTSHSLPVSTTVSFNEHRDIEIGTPKSDILSADDPNVPTKFTRGCRGNRILKDYGLIGGQRAGVYTLRGITPDFDSCIGLCCAEMMCDAAFLLGRRCFSVQCFRNGACAGRPATSHGLRSKLAFVERKDDDMGEKRASIPGLLPTDRQYTVYLNITNEDYKEGLRDHESLEFLNFAQAVRAAISGILGNVEGFKNIEILKFQPNKVIAVFNITTDQSTRPKILLQLIVDSLRKGEVKTFDEPVSGKLTLDVRGFRFLNNRGEDLVCPPEHNFDAHWPLAIFGTSVNIPCPRDAKGLSNRRCLGSEDQMAKWDVPDFSDCVSQKYEDLFKEAQLLNSASVHSPELTPASVIDRILQLITTDTYGTVPPASDGHARNLHHHHESLRPANYLTSVMNRESLHTPEIEKLRKLVAARRRKMGNQPLADQKHKSSINLLSFFRGPTAKLVKTSPKVVHKPVNDVTLSGVTYKPNAPPLVSHSIPVVTSMNRSPKQESRPLTGFNSPSSKILSKLPRVPLRGHDRLKHVPDQQPLPSSMRPVQPNGRGFPQQSHPMHRESLHRFQNTVSNPTSKTIQLPINRIIEGLRNLDRPYTQDVRKINGNKVDPSLLLSQGYWSKPQKFQPRTRSVSGQVTNGQGFALPFSNTPSKPGMDWTTTRNSPTIKSLNIETPTGRRSSLPASGVFDMSQRQQQQHDQAQQRDQLQQNPYESKQTLDQQRDQQRDQLQQGSYYHSLSPQQQPQSQQQPQLGQTQFIAPQPLKFQQSPLPKLQPPFLSFPQNGLRQAISPEQLFIGPKTSVDQLNHQLYQNQAATPGAFGQVGTERPYFGSVANQNNYIVSIKKRRNLDNLSDSLGKNKTFPSAPSLPDLSNITSIQFAKRGIFDESRKSDEENDQERVLESLTSDEADGDDIISDLTEKQGDDFVPGLRVTGSATATALKDPSITNAVKHDIPGVAGMDERKRRKEGGDGSKSFRLIEKASYRPNDPDSNRNKLFVISSEVHPKSYTPQLASKAPGSMNPVVVNLPFSNGNDGSKARLDNAPRPMVVDLPAQQGPGKKSHKNAPQQGTSLDLLTNFNKMNPPDPRETSSYTEAHVDNPNINAVASAKIYHGDDTQSNGRTSTNIEITGVGDNQPYDGKDQGEKPVASTSPQNIQSEQNASDMGTEQTMGNEKPQDNAEVENKGNEVNKEDGKQSENNIEVEQKPEEPPKEETEKPADETGGLGNPGDGEEIPIVPLEDRNMTADDLLANGNEIPEVKLKKLTINETEETASKLGPKSQESELIFAFEKEHGENRSSMFGGDILLSADIFEELSNYMQGQVEAPSPQEIKEFIEAASGLLDEKNANEWKNAQRHLKVIGNEGELSAGDIDVQDWKSLRKLQSKRKPSILLEFVDDVEEYGKAASKLITKYNPMLQKPIIASNIIMQMKLLLAEDLDDRQSDDNNIVFPNYTNPDIAKWTDDRDELAFPLYQLAESIPPTSTIHMTFFLFKTVYKLQRLQDDIDENDDQEILDENPMKVGSELISMSIDPQLPGHLRVPVTVTLKNTNFDPKAQHECAFWNSTLNDWSMNGCIVVSFNGTHTVCQCNHLTTFGVLVDTSKPQGEIAPDIGGSSSRPPPGSKTPKEPSGTPSNSKPEPLPPRPPAPPPPAPPSPPIKATPTKKPVKTTAKHKEENTGKNSVLLWILIILIIVIIILLLCLCCLFCWLRRRGKDEPAKPKEIVSSSGSGTSVGSELLVDKSRLAPKRDKFQTRSNSPSPRDSPGWLKLKSNAEHHEDILMREKALLFSDYHQPFNFLYHEKEKPNTSLESVYGGSSVAPLQSSSSSSKPEAAPSRRGRTESGRRPADDSIHPRAKIQEGPNSKRNSYPPSSRKANEIPAKKTPLKLNSKQNIPNKINGNVMPRNLAETGSTSMEWDPYYLNTKKKEEDKKKLERKSSNPRRKSRNISPISEEDTGEQSIEQPLGSLVPNVGSDEGASDVVAASGSSYPLNTSDTSDSMPVGPSTQRKTSQPQKSTQRTSPPQRASPPQRTSPPQRSTRHVESSPPLHGEHSSLRESGEPSPPSSGRSDKSDKHTQYSGHRR